MKKHLYSNEEIIAYCKNKLSKSNKFKYINFWCFMALKIIERI